MKLEFSRKIFEKKKKVDIKFHQNPSSGRRLLHADGRTEGHDDADSRFSQICERA